ncbi:class III lanthionine synthetase LanKC [Streptomyces thermolineatus]|uniref:class III lanthionine synthetase LanKC n=1 Tax=Streptomyces thermolineatus TaxID=44033 RepID=UPI00384AFC91
MPDPQSTQLYCVADRLYYDTPDRMRDEDTRYPLAEAAVPPGWRRSSRGLWVSMVPTGTQPAEQGWKIHLSAVPEDAGKTLDTAARICTERRVPFKFLRSRTALLLAADKYMSRSSSGKFVTVYPADEQQFRELLPELVRALDGQRGPYVLSDLRIGAGPVFVRYGAFVERWCTGEDGTPVPALRAPSGELVPDLRGPVFRTPEWVDVPDVLEPHLEARREARDDDFPYTVVEALHFSNAGGIYLAEHRDTGEKVVLREARPHSGLDGTGTDAVERLHREYRALRRLEGLDCVPRVHEVRTVWEHHFLVEEYIEGKRLLEAVVARYPLVHRSVTDEAVAEYLRWVSGVTERLEEALDAVHGRGLAFGDLHPGNILLRPDGSVVLIDFEYAADLDEAAGPVMGAPGFAAPSGLSRADADRHALRAAWRMMLMPMPELADREPGKVGTMEAFVRERFGLPADAGPRLPAAPAGRAAAGAPEPSAGGEAAVRELFGADRLDWPSLRDRLAAGIRAGATPERTDRLFPADPEVFRSGGAGLAHGAAGVLFALHRAQVPVPAEYTDWLVDAARRAAPAPGLYDGLSGTAVVLHELGRTQEALEVLERARAARRPAAVGMFSGQVGTALALLHFSAVTGDGSLLDEAVRTADRLAALLDPDGAPGGTADGAQPAPVLPGTAGLIHGMSGAALLHLRLYETVGDKRCLRAAREALRWETGHCVTMPDGTRQVKNGRRHTLYLDGGSGGPALVARHYLAHADDPELAGFVSAVGHGCANEFVREPGLFRGRSGLLAMLDRFPGPDGRPDGHPDGRPEVLAQVRRLAWHAVARPDGGLYFPGAGLRRFSADLATGSAGVLLALNSVLGDRRHFLPLMTG